MAARVKRDLAGRMNQYVNRLRKAKKDGSFRNAISNQAQEGKISASKVNSVGKSDSPRIGRRSRNKHLPTFKKRRSPIRYAKHITKVQAGRLAKYAPVIKSAAVKYNVPVELICGVILQESGGNYKAVSHCGARGLMQLMPATAKRLGVRNSFDPTQNIMGGTKYLRFLLDRFKGNMSLALAGYNAGEGNVEKYGNRIPPFKETKAYVPSVLKYSDTIWNMLRTRRVTRASFGPPKMSRQATIYHRTIYNVSRRA